MVDVMIVDMLAAARHACGGSDVSAVDTVVSQALASAAAPEQLINIGIICRDQAQPAAAFRVFDFIVGKWPAYVPAYYEAAFARRLSGEHLQSARLLLRARQHAPYDLRVATSLIHMLHAIGAHDEAARQSESIVPLASPTELTKLEALKEFGSYLTQWPGGKAMLLLDRVKRAYTYLDTRQVAERVIEALDTRRPFALIRLGDGEGSCITLGRHDETSFTHLYAQNRRELNAMWFGPDFRPDETGFTMLSRTILSVALNIDVVGIPYESWLAHEYVIASLRGVPSLVNILRAFEAVLPAAGVKPIACSQQIHMDLQRTGQLDRIIRHARRVSVITCLTELPELLQRHFVLDEVTLYRIPGEKGSAAMLGCDAAAGTHYPDAYAQLRASLECPHNGRLFLIAGGILGKFYAATIKQFGGVALDIGSIADAWACKPTRPGMKADLALCTK